MIKLKLIEEIIRKDRDLREIIISREPVNIDKVNLRSISFDSERIRLNFGSRSLYVFGKTENNVWTYFLTVYEHTGKPAGPLFWALPGSEDKVIKHIKEQFNAYTKEKYNAQG